MTKLYGTKREIARWQAILSCLGKVRTRFCITWLFTKISVMIIWCIVYFDGCTISSSYINFAFCFAFYEWLVREVLKREDKFLYRDSASAKKLADIHLCETTELKPFLLYNGTRSELDLLWIIMMIMIMIITMIIIMLSCPCQAPAFSFLLNRFFSFLCKEILFALHYRVHKDPKAPLFLRQFRYILC